jgi:uncharacterized membrane protein
VFAPLPLPKSRLEALTDGIFAVTMTLLVLDLRLPEHLGHEQTEIVASLLALLPHVDDYVISFVVLCVFWLAHLRLLARLRDVDATFVWLNLAFLLFTTFVPTLTSLIGNNADRPVAAILYGCNLLLILLCETLMWRHASRHHFNDSVLDAPGVWQTMRKRFLFAAAVIVAGIACALLEIALAARVDYASYVYLLLIVAGLVRKDATAKWQVAALNAPAAKDD